MYLPLWSLGISSTSGLISWSITSIFDSPGTADLNPRTVFAHFEVYRIIKKEQVKKIKFPEFRVSAVDRKNSDRYI